MGLNYEKERARNTAYSVKSETEKLLIKAKQKGFPNCKGLYPDCPEVPDKECSMCRSCPVND